MTTAAVPRPNDGPDFVREAVSPDERRSVGLALKLALVDFYHHSWRLLVLNTSLSVLLLLVVVIGLVAPVAFVLLLAAGPLAAALTHCTVVLAQTGELTLGEALRGLRLHWRRGVALLAIIAAAGAAGVVAIRFYGDVGWWAWPLAGVVTYVLALVALWQLALWPVAIYRRDRPLADVARRAALELVRRPVAYGGLALVLLVLNMLGAAAALVPFLTLTISYSFLTAAHFALPKSALREDPR